MYPTPPPPTHKHRIGFFDVDEYFVTEAQLGTIPTILSGFDADDVAAVAFNRLVRRSARAAESARN